MLPGAASQRQLVAKFGIEIVHAGNGKVGTDKFSHLITPTILTDFQYFNREPGLDLTPKMNTHAQLPSQTKCRILHCASLKIYPLILHHAFCILLEAGEQQEWRKCIKKLN